MVDVQSVRACFASIPQHAHYAECIGDASNICQTLEFGGDTLGIGTCLALETEVWDAILNEEYQSTRKYYLGFQMDAQRAWIAFRDADCALAYESAMGGSIRAILSNACRMRMTAERALALHHMRHE